MSRIVTVGLDSSPESSAAADWAAGEASARGASLRIAQVHQTGAYPYSPIIDDEVERRWAREMTDGTMTRISERHPELRIFRALESGNPADVLTEFSSDSELLVLGSRGLSQVLGFVVGSVALQTVAHTKCPTALLRAETKASHEELPGDAPVVVGIDLYRFSEDVVSFAFETAARNSRPLLAVYGWQLPPAYGIAPSPYAPDLIEEQHYERSQELAEALHSWQQKFPEVRTDSRVLTESPADLLMDAAADAWLLVVGRRNRRSRIGSHVGPTAHAVMHHARTAVAIVPHD